MITTPTLTKLLDIRIDPSSLSGISISFRIRLFFLLFSCLSLFISEGESEKYATSDPEISAEHIRSRISTVNQIKRMGLKGWKVILLLIRCNHE
jgi:uncharacterized protein YneF (UPF0154 family)